MNCPLSMGKPIAYKNKKRERSDQRRREFKDRTWSTWYSEVVGENGHTQGRKSPTNVWANTLHVGIIYKKR